MLHELLVVCEFLSVPFICVYLFYSVLLMTLPDYQQSLRRTVSRRMHGALAGDTFSYVFLLPCLNEAKVLQRTLDAILTLPTRRLLIIVIDDGSDDDTAAVVRALKDRRIRLIQRRLPHARQGKGAALNHAYRWLARGARRLRIDAETVIVGVMDGDGRPSHNLLAEAAKAFADHSVGAAQARIHISNRERLMPLMQDVEFAVTVGAMQNARAYFGSVGLGGNGQFVRLSALAALGPKPWTACLLEDFDIGLRMLLAGFGIQFLSDAYVAQQGLTSLRRFIRQRARWVQGNMQCLRYVARVWRANLPRSGKLDILYFLSQPWMNIFGTWIQLAAGVAFFRLMFGGALNFVHTGSRGLLLGASLFVWLLLLMGPGVAWAAMYRRQQSESTRTRAVTVALYLPVYNLFAIPSVWLAMWRYLRGKNSWQKTERIAELMTESVRNTESGTQLAEG